ncbi:hypothetical protein HMPREF3044_11605 [Corynebacterium sp. HMSC073D01]|nr:hypothetical protein HMPREF3044_11605 [Corynebacterium sp. HMSC073D01]
MPTLPFPARLATTLATAMFGMLRDDPQEFARKVKERIRLADLPVLSPVLNRYVPADSEVSPQRLLVKQGKLSEAVRYSGADRSELIARRAQETIDQLRAPIVPGMQLSSHNSESSAQHEEPRVLFYLNNSLPHTQSGYTERSHNILTALKKQGVTLHVVTRLGYPLLVGKVPRHAIEYVDGIPYERLIPTVYPRTLQARDDEAVQQLVKVAKWFRPTILHTTTEYKNAIIVSRAAKILGIPWVYEVRGELESTWLSRFPESEQQKRQQSEFYQLAHAQETAAMKAASAVVSLSEVSKKAMVIRGVAEGKIIVVPNAVDESLIGKKYDQEEIRKELGLPNTTTIGTVTSVVGYEGLDDLIRATALLPDVTCLIVGDGAARPELEKLTRELQLTGRVIFAGRQPRESIWKWYAALDVFVLPRKDTPVTRVVAPIKAQIAQALGKPVVASDLPALVEITGGDEVYVCPEHPDELASAIRNTLVTAKTRKNLPSSVKGWQDRTEVFKALVTRS